MTLVAQPTLIDLKATEIINGLNQTYSNLLAARARIEWMKKQSNIVDPVEYEMERDLSAQEIKFKVLSWPLVQVLKRVGYNTNFGIAPIAIGGIVLAVAISAWSTFAIYAKSVEALKIKIDAYAKGKYPPGMADAIIKAAPWIGAAILGVGLMTVLKNK